jgi:hypothetical protein
MSIDDILKRQELERHTSSANNTVWNNLTQRYEYKGTLEIPREAFKTANGSSYDVLVVDDTIVQVKQVKQQEKVITDNLASAGIVSDALRDKMFRDFDGNLWRIDPKSSQEVLYGVLFIKHPVSGDWLFKSNDITYTRHRRLDHLPHYQAALDLAVDAVKNKRSLLDFSVGGVAMQFIKNDNGDKVLINSVQEPLDALDLTDENYQSIINSADRYFAHQPSKRGGFYKTEFIVCENKIARHTKDVWCWDNNGVIEILNPYTVEETLVDNSMAKYRLRKSDELLIKVLDSGNTNVALLLGKPGTGKTFFTDCYAKRTGAEYIYTLCHDGTNSEDLFYSINVGKAVLREADTSDEIYQAGVLLRAVRASLTHKVVVCIDEIDKASKRTENLFLDFAETYRVPFLGTQEQGVKENITLFFTSNGYRPHSEAFLRRCYRHHFDFLPRSVEISLIGGTFAPAIVDALTAIREGGASSPSIKEGMQFAHNLQFADNVKDVECLMFAHLCKEPEDMEILQKGNFANKFITKVF